MTFYPLPLVYPYQEKEIAFFSGLLKVDVTIRLRTTNWHQFSLFFYLRYSIAVRQIYLRSDMLE